MKLQHETFGNFDTIKFRLVSVQATASAAERLLTRCTAAGSCRAAASTARQYLRAALRLHQYSHTQQVLLPPVGFSPSSHPDLQWPLCHKDAVKAIETCVKHCCCVLQA